MKCENSNKVQYSYALVTPAKNEEEYIANTIESIGNQEIKPVRWVIVSDGSVDGTDRIARDASKKYPFIELIRIEKCGNRSFGSKSHAFQIGYLVLRNMEIKYVGNLDADITLPTYYYRKIIERMIDKPAIGVSSGYCLDKVKGGFQKVVSSQNHAVGAVHLWRKDVYDLVGGYNPVTVGGMDSIALFAARMRGWTTISFQDIPIFHHKPVGTGAARNYSKIAWRSGMTEYYIGTIPLFAIAKSVRRWRAKPILLSSLIRLCAYFSLFLTGKRRDVDTELNNYVRFEQALRLRNLISRKKIK
jgi:poly-beta-1,6-N-acetyl-D-glucosamine synthase